MPIDIQITKILGRGLKHKTSAGRHHLWYSNNQNPRKGIKTCKDFQFDVEELLLNSNNQNPRKGIKTNLAEQSSQLLIIYSNNQNPRKGIKTLLALLCK